MNGGKRLNRVFTEFDRNFDIDVRRGGYKTVKFLI
jgi:hypothetical protein